MAEIDLDAIAAAIPPRSEGDDRMIFTFVVDRADPAGVDAELDNSGAVAGAEFAQAIADWVGTTTDKVTCILATSNVETVNSETFPAVTGAELADLVAQGT